MKIIKTEFIGSFEKLEQCPQGNLPEYAFIGRSNVGKSSLINAITGKKELAKISGTPGKTQMINYFLINDEWYIVDLPGYGYAKSSKQNRKKWKAMIENYLKARRQLICVFILLDSRHELQEIDREFLDWIGENHIPFAMVYTKTDKLKKASVENQINDIRNELLKYWEELPRQFVSSARTGLGTEEILSFIQELNNK